MVLVALGYSIQLQASCVPDAGEYGSEEWTGCTYRVLREKEAAPAADLGEAKMVRRAEWWNGKKDWLATATMVGNAQKLGEGAFGSVYAVEQTDAPEAFVWKKFAEADDDEQAHSDYDYVRILQCPVQNGVRVVSVPVDFAPTVGVRGVPGKYKEGVILERMSGTAKEWFSSRPLADRCRCLPSFIRTVLTALQCLTQGGSPQAHLDVNDENVLYRDRDDHFCPAWQLADFDRMSSVGDEHHQIRKGWYTLSDYKASNFHVHAGWDLHAAGRVFHTLMLDRNDAEYSRNRWMYEPGSLVHFLTEKAPGNLRNPVEWLDRRVKIADAWLEGQQLSFQGQCDREASHADPL